MNVPLEAAGTCSDAEIEQFAAAEFEAWAGRAEDDDTVPSNSEVGKSIMPGLRLALLVMHKPKSELVEIVGKMFDEKTDGDRCLLDEFLDGIKFSKTFVECMERLCSTAEARVLSAMAVHCAEGSAK